LLTAGEWKIGLGDIIEIKKEPGDDESSAGQFGKCRVEEIHGFWGRYAIVSCVALEKELVDAEACYYLFWVMTANLIIPATLVQCAYQACIQQPLFNPSTV
jgi:hypothetical protein